jgi:hypothetical protein
MKKISVPMTTKTSLSSKSSSALYSFNQVVACSKSDKNDTTVTATAPWKQHHHHHLQQQKQTTKSLPVTHKYDDNVLEQQGRPEDHQRRLRFLGLILTALSILVSVTVIGTKRQAAHLGFVTTSSSSLSNSSFLAVATTTHRSNVTQKNTSSSWLVVSNGTVEVTLVIQLSGELGNHLSKIAAGMGMATWL